MQGSWTAEIPPSILKTSFQVICVCTEYIRTNQLPLRNKMEQLQQKEEVIASLLTWLHGCCNVAT